MSIFYWVYWSTGHNFKVAAWRATALMGLTDSVSNWATLHSPSMSVIRNSRITSAHLAVCLWTLPEDTTTSWKVQWVCTEDIRDKKLSQARPHIWLLCSPFEVFEVHYVTVLKRGSGECRDIIKMNAKVSIIIAIICSEREGLKTSHNNINRQANDIFFKKTY